MFLEFIVTTAIIIGFILNVLYVDHPDTRSYTIYFVLGLLIQSPFILLWRWWKSEWGCGRRHSAGRKLPDGNVSLLPLVNASTVEVGSVNVTETTATTSVAVEGIDDVALTAAKDDDGVIALERDLEMGLVDAVIVNGQVSGS
ncbi:hypothetical protein B7463_g11031, partial [Scytalidium lignicola]